MAMVHTNMSAKPDTSVKNTGQSEDTKPNKKVHVNGLAIGQYSIIAILCEFMYNGDKIYVCVNRL